MQLFRRLRSCSLSLVRKRASFLLGGLCLFAVACIAAVSWSSGVADRVNCTGYYELAHIDFLADGMRKRLCENATAFTIAGGRFRLCQLARTLPEKVEREVRRAAVRDYIPSTAERRNVTIFRYRGADVISERIARTHSWEPRLVARLLGIMKALPRSDVTFLDVGSNIGVYSLQALDAGFPTIAVDANIRNLVRMRLAVGHLAEPRQLQLRLIWAFFHTKVAVQYLVFDGSSCNVGGARGMSFANQPDAVTDTVPVATAVADDLIPLVRTSFVVLKIDIETSERAFFESSRRLLEERQVAVVQMEWWRSDERDSAATSPNYRFLVDFFSSRNYVLMSPISLERLNPETFRDWDTLWVRWDFVHVVKQTLERAV